MTNVKKDLRERVIENHTFYGLVSYVIKMTKSLYQIFFVQFMIHIFVLY